MQDHAAFVVGVSVLGRNGERPRHVEIVCPFQCGCRLSWRWPARVDVKANANTSDRGGAAAGPDDAPLPLEYGDDRLELMVRDPTSAHAYWDLSVDRIEAAVGPHDRRRAFLRLIAVPSGYLLAEYAVPAERGSQPLALPEADSSYMVELAVMHKYQWVVLARSNVIHAPPQTPRAGGTPAFVSRAQQLRLLAEDHDRELDRAGGHLLAAPTARARHVAQAAGGPASVGAAAHVGPDTRLLPAGSEHRLASELRLARAGSEARLTLREPSRIPFVMAGSPAMTTAVAAALGALAAAVWHGRDPVEVLRAGNTLLSALANRGISAGPAVAILDPPEPDVAPPEPARPQTSSPGTDAYTVSHSPDGSITVIDSDGNFITYTRLPPAGVDGPRTRSAAAIVGVRNAF